MSSIGKVDGEHWHKARESPAKGMESTEMGRRQRVTFKGEGLS